MLLICKIFLVMTFLNTNIFPQSLFSLGFDIKSGQCNYNKLIASNPYDEGDCNVGDVPNEGTATQPFGPVRASVADDKVV